MLSIARWAMGMREQAVQLVFGSVCAADTVAPVVLRVVQRTVGPLVELLGGLVRDAVAGCDTGTGRDIQASCRCLDRGCVDRLAVAVGGSKGLVRVG